MQVKSFKVIQEGSFRPQNRRLSAQMPCGAEIISMTNDYIQAVVNTEQPMRQYDFIIVANNEELAVDSSRYVSRTNGNMHIFEVLK
jgi:hypothetical protein